VVLYDGMEAATIPAEMQTKQTMKDVLQSQKGLFQLPKVGELVEGTVIGKESGVLYIDLGIIGTGVIYGREYFAVQDQIKKLKPGDSVSAKLIELENEDGYRELSLKEAGEEKSWKTLFDLRDNKELVEVKITEANRGGLLAQYGDMSGFIPVSQLAPAHYPRVEGGNKEMILEELRKFVGQTLNVRVLDVEPRERKLIFSERAAETDNIKEALAKYSVGDVVKGQITGVVDFGAFIKFDPLLEGLIHISELDWNLVKDPRDVVTIGKTVEAKIVDVASDGRVSLSLKALREDPWAGIEKRFKKDAVIEGVVTKVNSYGALIKIDEGIQGLVHISEFSSEDEMHAQLQDGTTHQFEVVSVDSEKRKIALKPITPS
jgi:small subunit ribosomal protein S1